MDRDEVLPLEVPTRPTGFGWDSQTAKLQRDADWERVKPLVEAAQNLIGCSDCGRGTCAINLKMALARLGAGVKE